MRGNARAHADRYDRAQRHHHDLDADTPCAQCPVQDAAETRGDCRRRGRNEDQLGGAFARHPSNR
jgi:hypothetical protein